jgi:hypothetical protein
VESSATGRTHELLLLCIELVCSVVLLFRSFAFVVLDLFFFFDRFLCLFVRVLRLLPLIPSAGGSDDNRLVAGGTADSAQKVPLRKLADVLVEFCLSSSREHVSPLGGPRSFVAENLNGREGRNRTVVRERESL